MVGVTYSVREEEGTGYGPVIGSYEGSADVPPDSNTLIDVNGRLMRITAVRGDKFDGLNHTIIVEPYADSG